MKIAVIGGKLQGVEAAYLAKKAGWEVMVIDRNRDVPAETVGDSFVQLDVNSDKSFREIIGKCQLVIPALEDKKALESICLTTDRIGVPLAFDSTAYQISSSKAVSNNLFQKLAIPIPELWPKCRFPVIVKPTDSSGSDGVKHLEKSDDFQKWVKSGKDIKDWIIQEFLTGPSYSIEVIGCQGSYRSLQVTELEMDKVFDCKRVIAPARIDLEIIKEFENIGVKIAQALELEGIMDVEVILADGEMKVLEIDARLPSQTPTAVYHSTGVNMVQILGENFGYNKPKSVTDCCVQRGVVYEHVKVSREKMEICGEHVMGTAGPLKLQEGFFGADEALTNYEPGKTNWVATLINTGISLADAWEKRSRVLKNIAQKSQFLGWEDLSW
ncbi:MAG: 3-methylornithine--L-lysine ligase PylC [Desulfitobacteriaceae bacterium]|nr:3-methylornithine--L-lysine ligase PylC [Desulfitobacteriaceae bacterium]MDD4754126.1 3-methylornithine--L-lysine ligase PylC [Desulfitobacteriaceae bacterium]